MTWFGGRLGELPAIDIGCREAVAARAAQVIRPAGAFSRLDEIAAHVAGWQRTTRPAVTRPAVIVFAADHGVAAAGVSAYPTEVTAAMLAAVRAGKATINLLADSVGATVTAIDVGVGDPTADIRFEAAMSPERFESVIATAVDVVDAEVARGTDLLALGELGIGNTTVAAALAATLLGGRATRWVGRGTGVDDIGLARKEAAVVAARDRVAHLDDPIEIMRQIGGAEFTAIAAACVRAREHRLPVVLDGYLTAAAVLPVHGADPAALDHCLAGHVSAEAGHRSLLSALGLVPLLDLELRLGEGSGAVAAVPLVAMACAAVTEVPTFSEWFGNDGEQAS